MYWDPIKYFFYFVLSYIIYFNKITVILFFAILLEDIIRIHGMALL